MIRFKRILLILSLAVLSWKANADSIPEFSVTLMSNVGDGDFAPSLMLPNTHGVLTQPCSALISLGIEKDFDDDKRQSFGYGAKVIGGYSSKTDYQKYDIATKQNILHGEAPAAFWIQELYASLKHRSVFVYVGMKENGSKMLNDYLSSGDMTWSGNTRPLPGLRAGFIEPQDVPFANGWLQISGEIGYYKQTDNKWLENHYNYYNNFLTTDLWLNYKYCYFHSDVKKPFSVMLGIQSSVQFGGKRHIYLHGNLDEVVDMSPSLETFMRTMIPGPGGNSVGDQNYVEGNHVGSWDVMGRYRFTDGTELKAYIQKPWEDGSGVGFMNGFDALYGVEYKSSEARGVVTGAVVEYLDLMNQGGAIHWAPEDFQGTTLYDEATGADNYYNNYAYNGYQYYGVSLGSPVLKSPIYNTDGYMAFTDTRLRSIHVGVEGAPWKNFGYRVKFAHTKSWGTIYRPWSKPRNNTSAMVECVYDWYNLPGLRVKGQVAFDRGDIYGDNFGVSLSITYTGLLKF